ncbi:hypothetical protein [Polycladidibacter hongkongensis]|uniref:hypothetical protein n=1 Tax=Polycladidibacter hongkongensis TaxID=1647556 RepID=UPI00082D0428|nr:hypothetical protein [Pseudovibrio hongkongensis]
MNHRWELSGDGNFAQWGPIASFVIPTATTEALGEGQWQAGIGGILAANYRNVFTENDSVHFGIFGHNLWSFAQTRDNAQDVNKLFVQPIVVYHFNELLGQKGWYAALPDDFWVYDWNESQFDVIAAGLRVGRVFKIGDQPVNVFGQGYWNGAKTDGTPQAFAKLNFTLLFPTR